MRTQEMLRTHPRKPLADFKNLASCITALIECADTCTICADACLGEEKVPVLVKCVRLNLDCADVCQVTARILSRQTEPNPEFVRMQLETCAMSCAVTAQECEKHAERHYHCNLCRAACRTCEKACRQLLSFLAGTQ